MNDRLDGDQTDLDPAAAPPEAAEVLTRAEWMAKIDELCAEEGYFEPVGQQHHAWFHDDGPTLLVSFEQLDVVLGRQGQMPFGHDLAETRGWSHLAILCEGETWFRDPALWGYFDRLVDEAFFEDFDRVLFYGAGMGGHAACAYCVCAPGSTVVAVSPRATLDPSLAGWDRRNPAARRQDFTSRYGYAPDMIEGASQVYVIYDPLTPENDMHAALFRRPWVTPLRVRHFGDAVETVIELTGIFPELATRALDGSLTPASFGRIWRTRRRFGPYLRGMLRKTELAGRPRLSLLVCRWIVNRFGGKRLRRRLQELEEQLGIAQDARSGPAQD